MTGTTIATKQGYKDTNDFENQSLSKKKWGIMVELNSCTRLRRGSPAYG